MTEPESRWTCAACGQPIPTGQEGIVTVSTRKTRANPDGVVSVYVHDAERCRKNARA